MRTGLSTKVRNWLVVGVLMVLMSMASVSDAQAQSLSEDEIAWLTYMCEEEKLARDVYLYLYKTWRSRIFTNIAASEQTHMDAIEKLLVRYNIPDPAVAALGEFTNPDLQALYNRLIEAGSRSLVEALQVGVEIEETDIADLTDGIAASAHNDIITVYGNLLAGSLNHLNAFNSNLARY
jgi:hypothetical protein